jgi:hypothetical protein
MLTKVKLFSKFFFLLLRDTSLPFFGPSMQFLEFERVSDLHAIENSKNMFAININATKILTIAGDLTLIVHGNNNLMPFSGFKVLYLK